MRLVFIHGINQQRKSSNALRDAWLKALGIPANLEQLSIDVPFYGDALVEAMDAGVGAKATSMACRLMTRSGNSSLVHCIRWRWTTALILRRSWVNKPWRKVHWLLAILRVLESISPLQGEVALRVVRQAYAYLKRDEVAEAVDAKVRPALETGQSIVVAHSLGTVVAFKLLRAHTQDVPLFVTLGSPLGLMAVQSALKRPRLKPTGVGHWYNGLDPNDLVTLGKPLTSETFAPNITNKSNIDNGDEPHGIERYLHDADVQREIREELKAQGSHRVNNCAGRCLQLNNLLFGGFSGPRPSPRPNGRDWGVQRLREGANLICRGHAQSRPRSPIRRSESPTRQNGQTRVLVSVGSAPRNRRPQQAGDRRR